MDPEQLLQQLAPLREPAAVHWWPLAPGWWVLAILVLSLAAGATLALVRYRRRNRYRRLGRATLKQLVANGPPSHAQLNQLLKAVALRAWPASQVAGMHGDAWVNFLNRTSENSRGSQLDALRNVYRHPEEPASPPTVAAADRWIKAHRCDRD